MLPDHPAELLVGRQARAQHERELPRERLDRLARDRGQHLFLGPEVRVERRLGHGEPGGDAVQGRGAVPLLAEEVRRHAEDLLPDRPPSRVHGPECSLTPGAGRW